MSKSESITFNKIDCDRLDESEHKFELGQTRAPAQAGHDNG